MHEKNNYSCSWRNIRREKKEFNEKQEKGVKKRKKHKEKGIKIYGKRRKNRLFFFENRHFDEERADFEGKKYCILKNRVL
ncbi:MAG: hypothetical protein IK141_03140 [Clostridia bacterium]|nr:hypothetical protein [Clostridia bacterium]